MQSWKEGTRGTQVLKTIMQQDECINSIFVDEQSQSAFVGISKGDLNQINLRSQQVMKQYKNLGIGPIICLSSFNNLLFAGGNNNSFSLINITERRVLTVKPVKTSMRYIFSSHFTIINRNNNPTIALTVSGSKPLFLYLYIKLEIKNKSQN